MQENKNAFFIAVLLYLLAQPFHIRTYVFSLFVGSICCNESVFSFAKTVVRFISPGAFPYVNSHSLVVAPSYKVRNAQVSQHGFQVVKQGWIVVDQVSVQE